MKKRYYIFTLIVVWLVMLWNFTAITFIISLPFLILIAIYTLWTLGLLLFNAITGIPVTEEDVKRHHS